MQHSKLQILSIHLLSLAVAIIASGQDLPEPDVAQTTGGVVASDSPLASNVGRDILLSGGNAVDAAVATGFALAVTWPEAGNIGGGGFMMIAPTEGDVVCVDYREKSPLATDRFTFVDQKDLHDSRMVGVPGTVRGFELAHKKFGKLKWSQLVAPAIKLARDGFVVDEALADSINGVIGRVVKSKTHHELRRIYSHPDGRDWKAGDSLKLPELARVLERISNNPDDFYRGETAKLLVDFMAESNGLIRSADLDNYRAIIRPAIRSQFFDTEVFGAPPPSSGGLTIGLALNVFEQLDVEVDLPEGLDWSEDHLHSLAEIMKRAFRERAAHLGDADFVKIPDHFLSEDFAKELAASIDQGVATPSQDLAGEIELNAGAYESTQTTHFSVIDQEGMAVSNTYTLEASWGSRVIAPGTGFVLNNEMGDFNWYPGYTNLNGRIGTQANLVAPSKRMLSSMSPTLLKKNGKVILVVGSPGGRTIINTTLGVILQNVYFNQSLEKAVLATRFHHQWLPDILRIEKTRTNRIDAEAFESLVSQLRKSKHKVAIVGRQGSVHAISVDPQTNIRTGVSDFRRGGKAAVTTPLKSNQAEGQKKQGKN